MILLIDNYDSFTWNLYQYFCELGADVLVRRNDALTLAQANCTITYNATVTNDVNPGTTYQNLASAAWDSLENPPAVDDGGNRRGSTGTVRDNFTILAPMLTKVVASTSLGDTGTGQHTGLDDLAIGERIPVPAEVRGQISGCLGGPGADDEPQSGLIQVLEVGG